MAGLSQRLQSVFCRLHALHHHMRGIGACSHLSTAKVTTASGSTKPRHWCTSTPIPNSSARDQGQIQCSSTITTSSPRIQILTTMGTKQRASETMTVAMMMMAMMMMVSSGHLEAKLGEQMNQGHNRLQTTMLIGKMQMRLIGMVSRMRAQLEVRIVETVLQRLVMEVFAHPSIKGI
jgi:hypothetical protein